MSGRLGSTTRTATSTWRLPPPMAGPPTFRKKTRCRASWRSTLNPPRSDVEDARAVAAPHPPTLRAGPSLSPPAGEGWGERPSLAEQPAELGSAGLIFCAPPIRLITAIIDAGIVI